MNQTDRQLAAQPLDYAHEIAETSAPEHDCKWLGYSRTVWLNAIAAALGVLEASTGALREVLGPDTYTWALIGLAVANVVLRTLTNQPLRLTRQPVTGAAGKPME